MGSSSFLTLRPSPIEKNLLRSTTGNRFYRPPGTTPLHRTRSGWGWGRGSPPPMSLDIEQFLLHRVDHGLHPGVQVQLVEDVADVVLHGVLGDEQLLGDVFVVQALRDELQDLHLPRRELRTGPLAVAAPLAHGGELREELRRHGWGDPGLARPYRADRVGDLLDGDLLQE